MNQAHALYRFYDATGALLYVGITVDPGARWRKHAHDKPWWQQITHITIEPHPDRRSVLQAERTAIQTERPHFNIVHNTATTRRPVEPLVDASDMPDDCHDHCVPAGRVAIYLPFEWTAGEAHYQCTAGHRWTCWWGHNQTGTAPQWRGHPYLVLADA